MTDIGQSVEMIEFVDGPVFDSFRDVLCDPLTTSTITGSDYQVGASVAGAERIGIRASIKDATRKMVSISFGRFSDGDYFPGETLFLKS